MHPVLFQIGNFVIGTYGVMIVIGMLSGLWLSSRLARRRGQNPEFLFDLTFVLLFSGLIGARIVYILLNFGEFTRAPLAMILSRQGFVFLGGFATALAVGVWFARRRRMPLLETCDMVAPGLVLAHAFGRIGCFLAGCCYGRAVVADEAGALARWLAVQFPLVTGRAGEMFNFAYYGQIEQSLIAKGAAAPLPVLPVQLFESAGNVAICLGLLWLWRRRRFSGQVFASYLLAYGALRFGLEFLRGDAERGLWLGGRISTSQLICLAVIAGALLIWAFARGRGIDPLPAGDAPAEPSDNGSPPPGAAQRPRGRRKGRAASRRA